MLILIECAVMYLLSADGGESGKWCLRKRNGKKAKRKNGRKKSGE
jgi:hypothetical protein